MANETLRVKIIKNCVVDGVHFYPEEQPREQKEKDKKVIALKDQKYVYGEKDCSNVEVTLEDFKYLITRNRAVSVDKKDVIFKENAVKIVDKKAEK